MVKLADYMIFNFGYSDNYSLQEAASYYTRYNSVTRNDLVDEDPSQVVYSDRLIRPNSDRLETSIRHFKKSRLDDVSRVEAFRWRIVQKIERLGDDWDKAVEMLKEAGGHGYHRSKNGRSLLKYSVSRDGGVYYGSGEVRLAPGAAPLEQLAATASPTTEQLAAGAYYAQVRDRTDRYCGYRWLANVALFGALQRRGLIKDQPEGFIAKINGRVYPCIPAPSMQDPRLPGPLSPRDLANAWPTSDKQSMRIVEL